ncbi:MAG: hypothetical protein PHW04_09205 [Candidatus Wallbacteria bacterium]|nr:hypothetical protein [Candidatus Wallbacteria bacterium]
MNWKFCLALILIAAGSCLAGNLDYLVRINLLNIQYWQALPSFAETPSAVLGFKCFVPVAGNPSDVNYNQYLTKTFNLIKYSTNSDGLFQAFKTGIMDYCGNSLWGNIFQKREILEDLKLATNLLIYCDVPVTNQFVIVCAIDKVSPCAVTRYSYVAVRLLILPGKKAYSLRDILINSSASFTQVLEGKFQSKQISFLKSEIARKYYVN